MVLDWIPAGSKPKPDAESASPALLRRRAVATIMDLAICYFIVEAAILAYLMVFFLEFFVERVGEAILLSVVGLIPVYLLYAFLFEWKHARTPGKKRMGLIVCTDDGDYPGVRAAAIRNVLRYVDWLPVCYLLGWLLARRSPAGRRLGDRFAGTLVVRPETAGGSIVDTVRKEAKRTDPS